MKTIFLALIAMAVLPISSAQSTQFNGNWQGEITIEQKGTSLKMFLTIEGNKVIDYKDDFHKGKWFKSIHSVSALQKDTLHFSTSNDRTFSDETQLFFISQVDQDNLLVKWIRKCRLYTVVKKIADEAWTEEGSGIFRRINNVSDVAISE
jgi:hypothetical protein